MSVPDEVRREAERSGELVRKKRMEIMELQADIDTLLRDIRTPRHSTRRTGSMPAWKLCNVLWR